MDYESGKGYKLIVIKFDFSEVKEVQYSRFVAIEGKRGSNGGIETVSFFPNEDGTYTPFAWGWVPIKGEK